jgi:hypothetical protein
MCFFLSFVHKFIAVGDQVIKRGGVGSGLTPPHFCDCPEPEFPTSYAVVFLCSVGQCKRSLFVFSGSM